MLRYTALPQHTGGIARAKQKKEKKDHGHLNRQWLHTPVHPSGQILVSIPMNPSTGAGLPLIRAGAVRVANTQRHFSSIDMCRYTELGRSGRAAQRDCICLLPTRGQGQPSHSLHRPVHPINTFMLCRTSAALPHFSGAQSQDLAGTRFPQASPR